MPHEVMVSWDSFSYSYKTLIENVLREFQKANGLSLKLWYHGTTVCFIARNEKPFTRSIQISIDRDEDGMFVEIIPEIYREDEKNGVWYVCEAVPQLFIRRVPFPIERSDEEFISQLTNELSAAWGNTYYITPDMLKKEIKLSSSRPLIKY